MIRAYLLYRDMTALVVLLACVVFAVDVVLAVPWRTLAFSVAVLVGEYLVVALTARNASNRLVANVLAVEGSVENKSSPKATRQKAGARPG
jgi:hypothetical protein